MTGPAAAAPRHGAAVEFDHVTKRFGGSAGTDAPAAVHDLSLRVPPGEICVLVGPSGCGKTTTLRIVNRLVEPTAGRVLIDGQDVASVEVTALRRRIGYVIQQGGLFPHYTVAQNVGTVPRLLGWPEARIRERVDHLLALVGLDPERMRARYPGQLSGGERQRVGVARAMAAEPPVMLMDEPFGAVDPIVRERLQDELLHLHRTLGTTILFVTHDVDEAIKLGDRVAVMQEGGHLAQYAPPLELLAQPANEFVARFVGADRGLKRLALVAVADAPLVDLPTARVGEPTRTARERLATAGSDHLLVLDEASRPLGWLAAPALDDADAVAAEALTAPAAVLPAELALRDALARLLESPVPTGVVVDAAGRYRGGLSLEAIAAALRAAAPTPDQPRTAAPAHGDGVAPRAGAP
ncbi:MAG TPA: ABC transporter ATP-binding protein [Chloroflexota bacterium]|nr:ABC transporter ATP-binding protein [Chloroflexota bacterium]